MYIIIFFKVNIYTYRTPHYQISGIQDYHKAMAGFQEHSWQASLDEYAYIFTNSHGGFRMEDYVGGFKPRTTFYQNVGIIQHDRISQAILMELVYLILEFEPVIQSYFPRWAFDEVVQRGNWLFGKRLNGYIALYSDESMNWVSDYELKTNGRKNAYIVEMGSVDDYGTFENFTSSLLTTCINVQHLPVGYNIEYVSPTQGLVKVAWDGLMTVNGVGVDLRYEKFENDFCNQEFNTLRTTIEYGTMKLVLDFENGTRTYTEL